ncbi:MAG: NBR1-Ig-like domain-containing protein [Anaerolineae bacterium]
MRPHKLLIVLFVVLAALPLGAAQANSIAFTRIFCDLHRDIYTYEFVVDAPAAGNYDYTFIVENITRNDRYIEQGILDLPATPVSFRDTDAFFSLGVETQFTDDVDFIIFVEDIGRARIGCDGEQTITPAFAPEPAQPPPPDNPNVVDNPPAGLGAVTDEARGCTNDLRFVEDLTIPDGTVLGAGQPFTKIWGIENAGTCDWTPNYGLVLIDGARLSGPPIEPLGIDAFAAEEYTFSLDLVAPGLPGVYQSYWQKQTAAGVRFGDVIFVEIRVVGLVDSALDPGFPPSGDSGGGLYVQPLLAAAAFPYVNLLWAGQAPCGVFDTEGHGLKIASRSLYPACDFPNVTVACVTSSATWTRTTIEPVVFTPSEVRFISGQHGVCGLFNR